MVPGRGRASSAGTAIMLDSTKYHGQQLPQGLVQVVSIFITSKSLAKKIVVRADDINATPPLVAGKTTLADVLSDSVVVINSENVKALQAAVDTAPDMNRPGAGGWSSHCHSAMAQCERMVCQHRC